MLRTLLPATLLMAAGAPASAQISQAPLNPVLNGRIPTVSVDIIQAQEVVKLRSELDAAKTEIAKLDKQLDQATNDIQKLTNLFTAHSHIVNGMVGVGLTSTIDGDKHFMRYVMPPYNNTDGLEARRTGGPVQKN